MTKPVLPFVEIMITQICNISCVGCTNYSDLSHQGYLTWEQGRDQIIPWLERIDIPDFGIMGGEPLVNPEVRAWLWGIRSILPNAQIRFTTNGLLLHKHLDILDIMHDIGNCVFKITQHVDTPQLEKNIQSVFKYFDWEPVTEFGINRFQTSNNMRFQLNRPEKFTKSFVGNYDNMLPHNSNPMDAFKICCQQNCPLLYKGRIYKCSTSGLLEDTLNRFDYPNLDQWKPFILQGLSNDCSDSELKNFIDNFGKAESICSQCPSAVNEESIIMHFENVRLKKI